MTSLTVSFLETVGQVPAVAGASANILVGRTTGVLPYFVDFFRYSLYFFKYSSSFASRPASLG